MKQNGNCRFTGKRLTFTSSYKNCKLGQTASLDRIDSSKGYEVGNIQWIDKKINWMKWAMSDEEFIYYCKLVTDNQND